MFKKIITVAQSAACISLAAFSVNLYAEDIEIYVNDRVHNLNEKPRALIIFDSSGSMDSKITYPGECKNGYYWYDGKQYYGGHCKEKKMVIAKNAIKSLINDPANNDIDFGLMRFYSDEGGYVISGLGSDQSVLTSAIDNKIDAGGTTPLSETLWEAYLYLSGQKIEFAEDVDERDKTIEQSEKYISPFEDGATDLRCDNSVNIILMTDGAPTYDNSKDTDIYNLASSGTSNYLDDLAAYMNKDTTDLFPGTPLIRDFAKTHTIGFGGSMPSSAQTLLTNTATLGGGGAYSANSSSELTASLNQIFSAIKASNTSFTAPSVASNNSNKVQSGEYVYYAMFYPSTTTRWHGNLKKFKVDGDNILDSTGAVAVVDGEIVDTAKSYWLGANSADGNDVKKGGANLQLTNQSTRKIYTDIHGGDGLMSFFNKSTALGMAGIDNDNDKLAAFMGTTSGQLDNLFSWSQGIDVDDDNGDGSTSDKRQDIMGDPLHSKPIAIDYGNDDIRLILGTNAGFVHMFQDNTDLTNGIKESWAFIPTELYPNLNKLKQNQAGKVYGMDAPVAVFFDDANNDGVVDTTDDTVLAFFGMRRGGKSYYALDITNPNSPKLIWTIKSGVSELGDYSELGQTWSKPHIGYINLSGHNNEDPVLIFGAGYDPQKDENKSTDTQGRGIYIVDAKSGKLLWSMTPSITESKNTHYAGLDSIPSNISILDSDYDGLIDRLYVGDTGGKVWRIDMPGDEPNSSETPWKGTLLSNFSTTNQKFFYQPEIARTYFSKVTATTIDSKTVITRKQTPYEAILIGSGDRANPVSDTTTSDYLYMIRDENTLTQYFSESPNEVPEPIKLSDLMPITGDPFTATLSDEEGFRSLELELSTKFNGWAYALDSGEKALAKPVVAGGVAYFSTFTAGSDSDNQCSVTGGLGSLYSFHLLYGSTAAINKMSIGESIPDSPPIYFSVEDNEVKISLLCPGCSDGVIPELQPVLENSVPIDTDGDGKINLISTSRLQLETSRSYIYRLQTPSKN
ncbi:pilin biogenesis protein [Pseudoalteromonas sp. C2R02]|uniref:PilC/PilY family type IV pilus protein n=1 Tax=Pseudoalteromonas sp. C2R02 TaxID=2841565 RepID=UPI001C0835DE|nr:pilin biogenesis protein [Pseudoalteromonas sp. C2R02]